MKLVYDPERDKFVWYGTFLERAVPKKVGFVWNDTTKRWETSDPNTAYKLIGVAAPSCIAIIKEKRKAKALVFADSYREEATIDVPCPNRNHPITGEPLKYRDSQKQAIAFAIKHGNILDADPTGTGKTVVGCGLVNALKPKRVLVVCPASVKKNWEDAAKLWLVEHYAVLRVKAQTGWPEMHVERLFVIINYDIIDRYPDRLAEEWDLVIADESHYLKTEKSLRSRMFYGNVVHAGKVIFLSATPLKNHPIELWPQVKYLDPKTWHHPNGNTKYLEFCKEYCGAHPNESGYGWTMKGEPTKEQLNRLENVLRSTIMIRRPKSVLLPELPEKERQIIEIPLDNKQLQRLIENEQAFLEKQKADYKALMAGVQAAKFGKEEDYRAAVEKMQEGVMTIAGNIATQRKLTAVAKIPFMIGHISTLLEGGLDKLVVFAHHREVLLKLYAEFGANADILIGGMSEKRKDAALDHFVKDPSCKVFIGSILASGLGINELAVSGTGVFAELTFVPADISQAEDRIHRQGQTHDSVLIQQVVFADSIDSRVAKILVKKQKILDNVLDSVEFDDTMAKIGKVSVLHELLTEG